MTDSTKQDPGAGSARATGRRVIETEMDALRDLAGRLGEDFDRAVELVMACKGRAVVTGMGKSGQICRKIAATLSSTGTASFFLHAAEAAHGDLGMFARGDVCIAVSNSGSTEEVLTLLPSIKRLALPLIAITGVTDSPLAEAADAVLDVSVTAEACPMGLAPTASTTATLAMGDALAVAVLEANGFDERNFALLHPGGALGQRLVRVEDIMRVDASVPTVGESCVVREALEHMSTGGLGVVGVVNDEGKLVGVVTDGDVRRGVLGHSDFPDLSAADVMTADPKTIDRSALAAEGLAIMERHSITSLFTVDPDTGKPTGIVHLHDLLKAGIA